MLIEGRKEVRAKLKEVNEAILGMLERQNAPEAFLLDVKRILNTTQELGINELRLYRAFRTLGAAFDTLMRAALDDAQKNAPKQ